MKKGVLLIGFIITALSSIAQDSMAVQKKINYFFTVNSGFLGGERMKSLTFTANTVHGITLGKRLRIGGGIGIDSYSDVQTMPLFGQVSFDVLQFPKENAIFLQAGYGWAHAWAQPVDRYFSNATSGGKIFSSMIGYRVAAGKMRISIAAGYKFQETHSSFQSAPFFIYASSFYAPYSQVVEHNYERFTVMLGVGWH